MVEIPAQPAAPPRTNAPQRRWVLIACCLASCAKLSEPPSWVFQPPTDRPFNVAWVEYSVLNSVVTLLSLGFLLVGGVLGDISGRRRVLLIGIGASIIANGLLLLSPALWWFSVTRLLAGAAGAVVLPLSLTAIFLTNLDQPRRRALAVAIYVVLTNAVFLLAGVLGQLMFTLFDWRAAFVLPTVLGIIAFVVAWRWVPESRIQHTRRLDAIGLAAWALTLLGLVFGLMLWRVAGDYALAVVSSALFMSAIGVGLLLWWDQQTPESFFASRTIPHRYLAVLVVSGVAMQLGNIGYLTQLRSALIAVYDYGVVLASIALAPFLVGMVAMVVVGTRRIVGARARGLIAGGNVLTAVVCVLTVLTGAGAWYPWLAVVLVLFGAGCVMATTAFTNVFLQAISSELIGVRTGISSAILQIGGALGNAFAGAVLATIGVRGYRQHLRDAGITLSDTSPLVWVRELLDPATVGVAARTGALAERIGSTYQAIYLAAFHSTLLVLAVICVVGSVVVWYGLQPTTSRDEIHLTLP